MGCLPSHIRQRIIAYIADSDIRGFATFMQLYRVLNQGGRWEHSSGGRWICRLTIVRALSLKTYSRCCIEAKVLTTDPS